MSKITLQSVSSVDNTLIAAINNNNNTLVAAIDNTISRDGTQPNPMAAPLDMNSNPIINIPFATSNNQPVALGQIANATTLIPALTGDVTGSFNGSSIPTTLQPLSGDVTSSGRVVTLDTINSNVGTFQGLTVNGKGLVTAASNQNYLTGNQTVTLTGPITGSGTTSIATTIGNGQVSLVNIGPIATTAQYLNDTASEILTTDQVWGAAPFVIVTFSATTTLDFSTFINMKETLTSNVTFANPSNVKAGQCGILQIVQGTGGQTASWGANFHFAGGTAPTLSVGAGAIDLLGYVALSTTYIAIFVISKNT